MLGAPFITIQSKSVNEEVFIWPMFYWTVFHYRRASIFPTPQCIFYIRKTTSITRLVELKGLLIKQRKTKRLYFQQSLSTPNTVITLKRYCKKETVKFCTVMNIKCFKSKLIRKNRPHFISFSQRNCATILSIPLRTSDILRMKGMICWRSTWKSICLIMWKYADKITANSNVHCEIC